MSDFQFNGEFGSEGAVIEKSGTNHFKVTLGSAPNHPAWPNKLQFRITQNAQGNSLVLDVHATANDYYEFNEYFQSWSYDGINWTPVFWQYKTEPFLDDTLVFSTFTQDSVYCAHQVGFSNDDIEEMISSWSASPYVTVKVLGQSYEGRNIYRIEITDPDSPYARDRRWVNYFSHQHPGEHNARWRMVGMIEWLLSSDAKAQDFRKRSINHFILTMSPDGVAHGYYRVNTKGVDMNRSYLTTGSDPVNQTQEAYICQADLESIMLSSEPVSSLWSMHTDTSKVSIYISTGTEMGTMAGPWTEFRDTIESYDVNDLISTPQITSDPRGGTYWETGPGGQFPRLTTVLSEGGGSLTTISSNKESGIVIIKALADYYNGTKEAPGNINWVRDGTSLTTDAGFTLSATMLSANWDSALDTGSGISRYIYAIGTAPGGTDTVNWTDNATALNVTRTGLNLTTGATYYFTVKAENGIGLEGKANHSDGQYVAVNSTGVNPPPYHVTAYPNPYSYSNSGTVKFLINSSAGGEVRIYTINGELVREVKGENGAGDIEWNGTNEDCEKLAVGVYIYRILSANGGTAIGKIAIIK